MKTSVPGARNAVAELIASSSRGDISSEAPSISAITRSLRFEADATSDRVPLAGDHVGLVPEPQATILPQDLAGRFEPSPADHRLRQPLVLDLRHINRRVPGGEQCRGPDRRTDLTRQRMHTI